MTKLLVQNKSIANNKTFKTISKTAEHHLNIETLKREDVLEYLLNIKQDGYFVVGNLGN